MNSAGLVISATARAPLLPRGLSRLPCLFPQPPSLSRQKASAVFSDRSLIFFLFPTPPPRPSAPIRVLDDAPPDHSALYPFTSRLTLPPPAPQMSFSLLPRLVFSIILMGRLLVPFCLRRRLATSPRDSSRERQSLTRPDSFIPFRPFVRQRQAFKRPPANDYRGGGDAITDATCA
jgi:hypothetical protein